MTKDDKAKELIAQYCKAEITGKQFCDAIEALHSASNGANPNVSGALDRIRGMIKYHDWSMPISEADRLHKHGVAEYNKAILDVLDVLRQ